MKMENKNEAFVDKQFILDAHKAACSEWKKKIESRFPQFFANTFNFGDEFLITASSTPLMIGNGLMPKEEQQKCLLLSLDYTLKIEEFYSYGSTYTKLVFTKKTENY
jgi:hypothetical protein